MPLLSIRAIKESTRDTPLFSQDSGTEVVRSRKQAFDEAVVPLEEDRDVPSWLEAHRDRLVEDPEFTRKQARSIWDVVPDKRIPNLSMAEFYKPYKITF